MAEKRGFIKNYDKVFFLDPKNPVLSIGKDGLPIPGRVYCKGEPYYSVYDRSIGSFNVYLFKSSEKAWCGMVRIVSDDDIEETKTVIFIYSNKKFLLI